MRRDVTTGLLGALVDRVLHDGGPSPFIYPGGYQHFVAQKERAFKAELARQQAAPPGRGDGR